MINILIIEDDMLLNRGIKYLLMKDGYSVISVYCYDEGYNEFKKNVIDLVLLDIKLIHKSGLKLCEEIRKISEVPVIFITANDTDEDVIKGFKSGCDDYISKPFSMEVLKQRVKAVLKRINKQDNHIFKYKDIAVDYNLMTLKKCGKIIKLTATEFKLIELLTKNRNQVIPRKMILDKLWDVNGNFVDENALSVNIRRLRQKIEDNSKEPKYIITVFGTGYTWGED
ncbi:response regulator transcription factor [Haloimpatiens sp. FM7315]|uniref:response regulator transcription factor n=1 Tax=Haloimpatiens sp. FM7315 TaxID=3298609 RepID=UPI0035A32AC9